MPGSEPPCPYGRGTFTEWITLPNAFMLQSSAVDSSCSAECSNQYLVHSTRSRVRLGIGTRGRRYALSQYSGARICCLRNQLNEMLVVIQTCAISWTGIRVRCSLSGNPVGRSQAALQKRRRPCSSRYLCHTSRSLVGLVWFAFVLLCTVGGTA